MSVALYLIFVLRCFFLPRMLVLANSLLVDYFHMTTVTHLILLWCAGQSQLFLPVVIFTYPTANLFV